MKKSVKYVGLDVHKDSITIAIADAGRNGEVRVYGKIHNDLGQIDKVMRKLTSQNSEMHCAYEAGPCGYTIYRHLTSKGIDCVVVAPALIPRKSGDRVKNDRRDATNLATLHRSGDLTPVYVPDQTDEALRDLVRTRKDIQIARRKVKQQINAFMLRQGTSYPGKSKWSKAHFNWLAALKMSHPAQQIALTEYLDALENHTTRIMRLDKAIVASCQTWRLLPVVKALQALRGVCLLSAVTIISELGDLSRFDKPVQLMSYLGLVPSEHSSGQTTKRGSITKTGNTHARRTLIESAQAYRLPARKSMVIRKRQQDLPEAIVDIAWNAQLRLCSRYRRLSARGKNHNLIITAIARELAGFIWAIARVVPIEMTPLADCPAIACKPRPIKAEPCGCSLCSQP